MMDHPASTPSRRRRTSGKEGRATERFSRPARAAWTPLPMLIFLAVLSTLVWLAPGLLWHSAPAGATPHTIALLCAGLAALVGFGLVRRWLTPNRVVLEAEQLVATPLLGPARRVPYADVTGVDERPPGFFRGSGELEISVRTGPPLHLDGDIQDHDRLLNALRARTARHPQERLTP